MDREPASLSGFILALREALLGMPAPGEQAGAEEIRAQLTRLEGLAKRLEARERELQEMLSRPPAGAESPSPSTQDSIFAQEAARLQSEVVRLLEARRKSESQWLAVRTRSAELEAEVARLRELSQDLAKEQLHLKAELGSAWLEARTHAAKAKELQDGLAKLSMEKAALAREFSQAQRAENSAVWGKRFLEAQAGAAEWKRFEAEMRELSEARRDMEAEVRAARELAEAQAAKTRQLNAELEAALDDRRRLSEEALQGRKALEEAGAKLDQADATLESSQNENGALAAESLRLKEELRQTVRGRCELEAEIKSGLDARRTQEEALKRLEERLGQKDAGQAESQAALKHAQEALRDRDAALRSAELGRRELLEERGRLVAELSSLKTSLQTETDKDMRVKEEFSQLSNARHRLEAELAQARETEFADSLEKRRLDAEMQRACQRLAALEAELEEAKEAARQAEETARRAEELPRLQAEVEQARGSERRSRENAEHLQAELKETDARAENLESELRLARRKEDDLKASLDAKDGESRRWAERARRADEELKEFAGHKERLEEALREARRRGTCAEELAARLKAAIERLEADRDLAGAELKAAVGRTEQLSAELDRIHRERMEELSARTESFRVPDFPPEDAIPTDSGDLAEQAPILFASLLSLITAASGDLRRLAASAQAAALRHSLSAVLGRLSSVHEQMKSSAEFFAAPPACAVQPLAPIIGPTLKTWEGAFRKRGLSLVQRLDPTTPACLAHRERLKLAVYQLLRNAYENLPKGGTLTVTLAKAEGAAAPSRNRRSGTAEAEGAAALRFSDNGPGLPSKVLADAATPFQGAKPGHLGLGLALTRKIMDGFGGRMAVSNQARGALIELIFSASTTGEPAGAASAVPNLPA